MRFLHTADWQIGMRAHAALHRANEVRAARLRTVERIINVANERDVDFVVVAGDQFEDRAPAIPEIGAVVAALRSARMPVYVLPGNHDPAKPDSPYGGNSWRTLAGSRVHTVMANEVYEVPGGVLLAAPCMAKYSTVDPTAWFADAPSPEGAIRVGLAHGTLELGPIAAADEGDQRGGFPIATNAASRAGLAYLALGHWHSHLEVGDGGAPIVYSGTPEQTRFSDRDCGSVAIVTIDGPRAVPKIERVPVGTYTWVEHEYHLGDDDSVIGSLEKLRTIPEPGKTLVRASFKGLCSPKGVEFLEAARAEFASRFFLFDERRTFVNRPESVDSWLEHFEPGIARTIVDRVLEAAIDPETEAVAMRALELMLEMNR